MAGLPELLQQTQDVLKETLASSEAVESAVAQQCVSASDASRLSNEISGLAGGLASGSREARLDEEETPASDRDQGRGKEEIDEGSVVC